MVLVCCATAKLLASRPLVFRMNVPSAQAQPDLIMTACWAWLLALLLTALPPMASTQAPQAPQASTRSSVVDAPVPSLPPTIVFSMHVAGSVEPLVGLELPATGDLDLLALMMECSAQLDGSGVLTRQLLAQEVDAARAAGTLGPGVSVETHACGFGICMSCHALCHRIAASQAPDSRGTPGRVSLAVGNVVVTLNFAMHGCRVGGSMPAPST
jgi:hypothetical protein